MPSFGAILIKLREELGYKKYTRGPTGCVFYAETAIDAFLVGEYESVFYPRRLYIESNYSKWPTLFKQAKEENVLVNTSDTGVLNKAPTNVPSA